MNVTPDQCSSSKELKRARLFFILPSEKNLEKHIGKTRVKIQSTTVARYYNTTTVQPVLVL
jgi:hypothetical protein